MKKKLAIFNVDCNKYVYKGAFCDGQKYQLELCEYDILKKQVENISRRDFIDELFTLKNEEISRFTEKEQEMLNEKKVDVNIEDYITDKSEKDLKKIEDYVDAVYTNYSIEVVIMIILKDGNRCYIDFLKKPTIARSWKCKKAFKEANEVKQTLLFMQKVGNYALQRQKSNITYIPRTLAKAE